MSEKSTQMQTEATPQTIFEKQFTVFTDQIVTAMLKISQIAERGPVILLLTLGTTLMFLAALLKIEFRGERISNLTPVEFIALTISATLLLILGSLMRLYVWKNRQEIIREQQKVGADLLAKTTTVAAGLVKPEPKSEPPEPV